MSESRIARTSPEDKVIASHTAFALPFFDCSINLMLKSVFLTFIFLATSRVLSEDFPIENMISQFSNLGILETNSSKFPSSFLAGIIIDFERCFSLIDIFLRTMYVFTPNLK